MPIAIDIAKRQLAPWHLVVTARTATSAGRCGVRAGYGAGGADPEMVMADWPTH